MSDTINFAVIGAGNIGKIHLQAIDATPGAQAIVLCNRRARELVNDVFGLRRAYNCERSNGTWDAPKLAANENATDREFSVATQVLEEQFDAWMTRQLNVLVGRWIAYATPNSATAVFPGSASPDSAHQQGRSHARR